MPINLDQINIGTGDDAGDGEPLRAGGAKINDNATKVGTFADGTGLEPDGTLAADPADAPRALAAGDNPATALWLLENRLQGLPAGLIPKGYYDPAANTPDLTQAANQGEIIDSVFYGYFYTSSAEFEGRDLGNGPQDYQTGSSVYFDTNGNAIVSAPQRPGLRPVDVNADGTSEMRTREQVDLSGGPITRTLPAATGSGEVIEFDVGDAGNDLTIAVQVGESLNGSVDGTSVWATAGTMLRAKDEAVGVWRVASNVTTLATPLSLISRHGSMNPGNGNPFQHGTENLTKGDITYAAGVYTIGTADNYQISYALGGASGNNTGYVSASLFVNGVATGPGIGVANDASNNFPFGSSGKVALALNAGDTVELRQTNTPGFNVAKSTSITIQQIPADSAIRAEDAKLSTDHISQTNPTNADSCTTQGVYEGDGTGSLSGAPVGNFVWILDVDVFGDHIKQTFYPMSATNDSFGPNIRRSFDGGATWTPWLGKP